MLTNFTRLFIYAGFEINKSYIASTLCENRDKPELNCNGKCYLTKKIKQAEEKEKSEERENLKKSYQQAFIMKVIVDLHHPSNILNKNSFAEVSSDLPQSTTDILHPPPRRLS